MKENDKEFYELREQFERDIIKMPIYIGCKIEREQRTENISKNRWYTNGFLNQLFIVYMAGYANAKCLHNML